MTASQKADPGAKPRPKEIESPKITPANAEDSAVDRFLLKKRDPINLWVADQKVLGVLVIPKV